MEETKVSIQINSEKAPTQKEGWTCPDIKVLEMEETNAFAGIGVDAIIFS